MSLTESDFKEIMEGKHPELAVEFVVETQLPVTFYLRGDLASLVENHKKCGTIEIKQTLIPFPEVI